MALQLQDLLSDSGHPHPLVFNEEEGSNQSEDIFCLGCKKEVRGPSFSCAECRFFLHKKCAEAPLQFINHPFHRQHPLILREFSEAFECGICETSGKGFLYHCSDCEKYLDMKCANLFLRDNDGNLIEISRNFHNHPLVSTNIGHESETYCDRCRISRTSRDALYACFDCGLIYHEKCLDLPLEISHPYHRKHRLILETDKEESPVCNLCDTHCWGSFYCCSLCDIAIHPNCDVLPSTIEDKRHHEHPFTLLLRPNSFDCDACGIQGNNVSYICSTCNLQVHKKCIPLPGFIRITLHNHNLSRMFFLPIDQHDPRTWDCRICYKTVNLEHGSYYCSKPDCSFITHVMCAIENRDLFDLIELESQDEFDGSNEFSNESVDPIIRVIREIKVGDDIIAAEIIHFSHEEHNLTLTEESLGNKLCDGCMLPILKSFYCCSHCDFFLHKACAELPKKSLLWHDARPYILHTKGAFKCNACKYEFSGFCYVRSDFDVCLCLRCAELPHSLTYQADEEHFVFFEKKFKGRCRSCKGKAKYRSKDGNFALDWRCLTLPRSAWHKCDKHSLKLTCGDYNDYPLHHHCDICEERRDPELWFYHCEVCDTTVHIKCALGDYPFLKHGITFKCDWDHPHPLTSVRKIYYYPL